MKSRKFSICLCCLFSCLLLMRAYPAAFAKAQDGEIVQVPVIMYHSLLDKKTNQWNISPEAFEKDLDFLTENGYQTVFISELIDYVYENKPLPEKPIVLTFDDGYYNNYSKGLPILKKHDAKITLSVIGANADHWTQHSDETDNQYGHLTWPQLSQMVESGLVELANHTQNLHKNTNGRNGCCWKKGEDLAQYEHILTDDIESLQEKLEKISGKRAECFTYPFGSKCDKSADIIGKLGFKATLSCASGTNNLCAGDPECLISMKRNNRTPNQSVESILKKLEAAATPNIA